MSDAFVKTVLGIIAGVGVTAIGGGVGLYAEMKVTSEKVRNIEKSIENHILIIEKNFENQDARLRLLENKAFTQNNQKKQDRNNG